MDTKDPAVEKQLAELRKSQEDYQNSKKEIAQAER
jgi:hypothetical protein